MGHSKIIFRADGSKTIGYGHVYRMLALLDTLKPYFECEFASIYDPIVADELKKRNIKHHILDNYLYDHISLKSKIEEKDFDLGEVILGNEIVVLDGYWFGYNFQKNIKSKGARVVSIDDNYDHEYCSDVIINHAPGIDTKKYRKEKYTQVRSGLNYLLLRPEFYQEKLNNIKDEKRIFISFGGSDYHDLSLEFVKFILEDHPLFKIEVLITDSFNSSQKESLISLEKNNKNLTIHKNYGATELVHLIDTCSHAIVSSSTILLEVFSRGIFAASGYYVENQTNLYQGMLDRGNIWGVGDLKEIGVNNNIGRYFLDYLTSSRRVNFNYNPASNLIQLFKELEEYVD